MANSDTNLHHKISLLNKLNFCHPNLNILIPKFLKYLGTLQPAPVLERCINPKADAEVSAAQP